MEINVFLYLIVYALTLTYSIFMLIYLNNANKCDQYLKSSDVSFRKAAVVITWIAVILNGLSCLALLTILIKNSSIIYI